LLLIITRDDDGGVATAERRRVEVNMTLVFPGVIRVHSR